MVIITENSYQLLYDGEICKNYANFAKKKRRKKLKQNMRFRNFLLLIYEGAGEGVTSSKTIK